MVPNLSRGMCVVYFLRLSNGRIYVGCSTDQELRLKDHQSGQACETTRRNPPIELLRIEGFPIFADARKREAQLKKWSGAKKEALACGDFERLKDLARSHDQKKLAAAPFPGWSCAVGAWLGSGQRR